MDDGKVHVLANSGPAAEPSPMIRDITASAEIGKTYLGKVVRLAEFGAFVEIFPGTDGLLHISEIAEQRLRDVRDALKLGDQVWSKCSRSKATRFACRAKLSCANNAKSNRRKRPRAAANRAEHGSIWSFGAWDESLAQTN